MKDVKESIEINGGEDGIWKPSFIPFIGDEAGSMLLFNNEQGHDYGKLYLDSASFMISAGPVTIFDSISAALEMTIEAYKTGAIFYSEEQDFLRTDMSQLTPIGRKYNPGSEFWETLYF